MLILFVVGVPCAIAMVYGIYLVRYVTRDKLRVCPGCNRNYHPSWGRLCGDCSGAQ